MSNGRILTCFVVSLIIIGFTFLTYGEAVENTIMGLINAGTMPEKYLSSEGWGFNYAPVEHFLILSAVFTVVYYGIGFLVKKRRVSLLLAVTTIALYLIGYIFVTLEFWQLIGITVTPMVFLFGIAIYNLISVKDRKA